MKKFLVIILTFFAFQITIKAIEPQLTISCPDGGTTQSTLKCTLKVKSELNIKEISLDYDFGNNISFISYSPASNFEVVNNNSVGFYIKSESGVTGDFTIGVVSFKLLGAGEFALKTIKIVDSNNNTYTATRVMQSIKILSEDNTLKSLTISPGSLTPIFQPTIENYKAEVDTANISITAVANDSNAKFQNIENQSLSYGENVINFVVTSESGSKRTYKLVIIRKDDRSTNNNLKSVELSEGEIDFKPENSSYVVRVSPELTKIKINASVDDEKASFVDDYGPREVNLLSEKNIVELRVKSENGVIKIYTFTFIKTDRELSKNNNIKELTLDGYNIDFSPSTLSYNIKADSSKPLNFKILLEDENAKYELINADLKNSNIVLIKVTAENGDIKEYKFNIEGEKDDETKVDIEEKQPDFSSRFLCDDNSIIYYLIVFAFGILISTLVSTIVYKKKIKKLEAKYNSNNFAKVSEHTEKLYFDDFNQKNNT